MDEVTIPGFELAGKWRFDWVLPVLFQPRKMLGRVAGLDTAVWQTPITILIVTGLIRTLVAGGIKQAAAATGQFTPPPGFEYYTPEQQAQFMQAMSATSGPVFTYLLPSVMAVLGIYVSWLVLGWILHLVMTLFGGRASSRQVLNIAAWASLPFAIRDVVRTVAMWNSGQLLTSLGLSGFAPASEGNAIIYLAALLTFIDIYWFWQMGLLVTGMRVGAQVSRVKAWTAVLLTVIGLLLLRALPALISAQFSDLTVIRPFF